MNEEEKINLNLSGRICADQITPYPPGIPVLVPGQIISQEIIHYIVSMLRSQKRIEIHGIVYDGYLPCLRLITATEEKKLIRLN